MAKIKAFITREWQQLSTKFGTVLVAISSTAPLYAQFDQRIAYAGAAAGIMLVLYRGKPNG